MRNFPTQKHSGRVEMRLFVLVAVTMTAFAANSGLNKFGLADGATDPGAFALIRVLAGAIMLCALVLLRGGRVPLLERARIGGALTLALYMAGFSLAYTTLEAGVGALILFGVVQITMFGAALWRAERVPAMRWFGSCLALGGLAYLLWPAGAGVPDALGAAFMTAAGIGWGLYSLAGAKVPDPLAATAGNFVLCLPVLMVVFIGAYDISFEGAVAGIISGAVTSALGYALWYTVLPKLETTVAAVAQLTVPVIALAGGIMFLGEALTMRFAIASVLVLGGVALSLRRA